MSWSDVQQRQQDAVFERLGVDADWDGIADPVRVIRRASEQVIGMTVDDSVSFRVRPSEVPTPAEGDTFTIGADTFTVIGQPKRDRNGTWRGEAEPS